MSEHLQRMGVSADAADVYEYLLAAGRSRRVEVQAALTRTEAEVDAAIEVLANLALALGDGDFVVPLDPEVGLQGLADAHRAGLAVSVQAAVSAFEQSRRRRSLDGRASGVEILNGAEIQRAVAEIERGVVAQVRAFDTPPYGTPDLSNPIELANLARGVSYRVAYAREAVEETARFRQNILPCIEAGEVARSMPSVPAKMLIADDRVAIIGFSTTHADQHHTALLVHQSSVLHALTELFELCWVTAVPLGEGSVAICGDLKLTERALLRQLAAGLTDDVIARNMGVSKRTVSRYVEQLSAVARTSSRFQLAVYAQRNGWLD